jgi:hypothetical protein
MNELGAFDLVLWGLTVSLEIGLLVLLLYRKNHRIFPFLFSYVLIAFLQSVVLMVSYRIWGFSSSNAVRIGWGTQKLVILGRALAVAEICRRVLERYRGIWALAWRTLVGSAVLVLLYSLAVAGFEWQLLALNADRGLELTITVVLVMLFLFAHYYELTMEPAVRSLAIGFFLYSCFGVLNDTILEGWKYRYATLWNLAGMTAYLASLLLWNWAVRERQLAITLEPAPLSQGVYENLAPEINLRLKLLNEHLTQILCPKAKRP